MPSIRDQYYNLSHRLRGIVTTYEAINYLMSLPEQNTPEIQAKLAIHFEKAKKQAEDFRKILEKRANTRDEVYQLFLAMISTLYSSIQEGRVSKEEILEDLNMFGFMIKKAIEYNRDIENDEQQKLL